MGTAGGVVAKAEFESTFEQAHHERRKAAEMQELFQSSPEAFEEGDGARLPYGSESVLDSVVSETVAEGNRGELCSVVAYEVSGWAETLDDDFEQVGEVLAGRDMGEEFGAERHSGEGVEDDGELEAEEAEEARDLGEIDEKDMVRELCG